MWPVLKGEKQSEYDEIVISIDQVRNISALKKGDWKIISGEIIFHFPLIILSLQTIILIILSEYFQFPKV